MKTRSLSLYSKGLIAIGEQDQELGPGSQQAALAAQLQQNDVCFMRKSRTKQNPNPKESDGCYL